MGNQKWKQKHLNSIGMGKEKRERERGARENDTYENGALAREKSKLLNSV